MFSDNPSGGGSDPELLRQVFKDIASTPRLTAEENLALLRRYAAERSEELRQRILNANLRLVLSEAFKQRGKGLSLSDLIQEGCFGLMRAVELFNAELGFRFSTYAVYWIRESMQMALMNTGRQIRLPASQIRRLNSLYAKTLRSGLQTGPALPEQRELDKLLESTSLARPASGPDGEEGALPEIPDPNPCDPARRSDEELFFEQLDSAVRPWFQSLTPADQELLRRRFGGGAAAGAAKAEPRLKELLGSLRIALCRAGFDISKMAEEGSL